jgi:hypothetical protein
MFYFNNSEVCGNELDEIPIQNLMQSFPARTSISLAKLVPLLQKVCKIWKPMFNNSESDLLGDRAWALNSWTFTFRFRRLSVAEELVWKERWMYERATTSSNSGLEFRPIHCRIPLNFWNKTFAVSNSWEIEQKSNTVVTNDVLLS